MSAEPTLRDISYGPHERDVQDIYKSTRNRTNARLFMVTWRGQLDSPNPQWVRNIVRGYLELAPRDSLEAAEGSH